MLHRDYLLEMIEEFVGVVARALRLALAEGDLAAATEVEEALGELLDLDAEVAGSLAPDSLVTMMLLSGLGDSLAAYASFSLARLAEVYAQAGERDLADLRRQQAEAVAESFGCDCDVAPEGLEGIA